MRKLNNSMSHAQEESALMNSQNLHQGYVELYHHGLFHIKSTALLCAVGLGIPSAIHRRGGAATVSDLVAETGVHPAKLSYLRRLMRALASSGIFAAAAAAHQPDGDEGGETVLYTLTPVSRILVDNGGGGGASSTPRDMSALLRLLARPSTAVSPFFSLEAWFRDGGAKTLFEMAHGVPAWSLTKNDASYNEAMNDACSVDTSFAMDTMLKEVGGTDIFRGLGSLVDVGGGHGAAAMAIARAFPDVKCSVLDLEQVISKVAAASDGAVQFIAGDMFESIPPADAVFLKVRT
jgi:Ca2+-transporting ATPase